MATPNKKTLTIAKEDRRETRLIPVTNWSKHHSWPPIGGLRYLIFNAKHNGIHKAIRRVGRRVLVDEGAFFEWVDEQQVAK